MIQLLKKYSFLLFIFIFATGASAAAQPLSNDSVIVAKNTTAAARKIFYDAMMHWSVWNNLSGPLDEDGEYDWMSSFWPMELVLYKSDAVKIKIYEAFRSINKRTIEFQRSLLELLYTNYPNEFNKEVSVLMHRTTDPKIFAMCAEYLWQNGKHLQEAVTILHLIKQKIPADSVHENPILMMLHRRLKGGAAMDLPPLADILSKQFAPGQTVMYSFQREDRNYPGLVIVRRPDGSFVRNADSSIFHVAQLALSISNLPSYLTNGNTPQGIFRTMGFGKSTSQFIGATENIQMQLPFEAPVDSFFTLLPDDTVWSIEKYTALLPPSWKNYAPIFNAYYAGKAGRTAIIAHGTTIDPNYYRDKIYYPETPSLGCLCASEIWSAKDGRRVKSDQQLLVNAMHATGNGYGYCVVIELGDKKMPVQLEEILPLIKQAGRENKY